MQPTGAYAATMFLVAIIAAVTLSSPFGVATASALAETERGLELEITIEMDASFEVVLVRAFSSFEELPPTAMLDRGDGVWGALVIVPTAENWSIVFDAIDADGEVSRSDTTDLVAMGVDPIVVISESPEPRRRSVSSSTWWLAFGAVVGLAAISLLAWWTFMPSKEPEGDEPSDGDLTNSRE